METTKIRFNTVIDFPTEKLLEFAESKGYQKMVTEDVGMDENEMPVFEEIANKQTPEQFIKKYCENTVKKELTSRIDRFIEEKTAYKFQEELMIEKKKMNDVLNIK